MTAVPIVVTRRYRREARASARRRTRAAVVAAVAVAVGLVLTAVTFSPLIDTDTPEVVTPVPVVYDPPQISEPLDAAGMADIALTTGYTYLAVAQREAWLQRLRARWLPVHECEQGGTGWVNAGSTSDGYFEGGMGHSASNYQKYAGHSANLDPPDVQMWVAELAHRDGVRWAPSCESRIGPPL